MQNQSHNDASSQGHEEDMDVGYEESNSSQTIEGLEQKFLDDIMKLSKEQNDAEDAENSRHREVFLNFDGPLLWFTVNIITVNCWILEMLKIFLNFIFFYVYCRSYSNKFSNMRFGFFESDFGFFMRMTRTADVKMVLQFKMRFWQPWLLEREHHDDCGAVFSMWSYFLFWYVETK